MTLPARSPRQMLPDPERSRSVLRARGPQVRLPHAGALVLAGLVCLGTAWTLPAPADAQQSSTQLRSTSQKGASTGRYRSQGRYRGAQQQTPRRSNRHLVSPMGSAANARPGYYRQKLSQPQHHPGVVHPSPYPYYGGYAPGYVVYVDSYGGEPRIFGQSEPAPPPEPAPVIVQPPPVYIIQAPQGTTQTSPGVVTGPYDPSTYVPNAAAAPPRPAPEPEVPPAPPRPNEPQAVTFHIVPADARVFLDDEPLGTAADVLARSPLILDRGVYLLEVEHPDFGVQRLFFGVDGAEPTSVGVDMTTDHPRRRTRVN